MYVEHISSNYWNYYHKDVLPLEGDTNHGIVSNAEGTYYYYGPVDWIERSDHPTASSVQNIVIHEKYYNWLITHNVKLWITSYVLYIGLTNKDWTEFQLKYV